MITQKDLIERFDVLEQSGQYDALLQEIDSYMNDNPDFPPLYFYRGNVLRYKGDLQGALSAYRWAILLDPNDIKARTNYAATLFDLKDYVGALNAADAAILMAPEYPDPYLICGNILSLLGFPEQAMYPYHHAYEFMPDNIPLGAYVAELYSQQEEPEDAVKLMMKLLEKQEKNGALHLQMACMLCFFMQNGVPLKDVEAWTGEWMKVFSSAFSREVYDNIMRHNLDYTPINAGILARAFDDIANVFDTSAEEEAISFINVLESAMHSYLAGRKDLTVLDIGCGTGLAASPVREYTEHGSFDGVDISAELLNIAKTRKLYNNLSHMDAIEFLSNKQEYYDAMIAANSLPYFGDLNKAFAAFSKALKPKGLMFFSIKINGLNKDDQILYPPYNYLFSSAYVRDVLKENGFTVLSSSVMQEGSDLTVHDKKHFYVVQKNG
ncbi:MAG: methyltransferase domain-containing protein [Alphaproteobacteria bacterium]